MSKYSKKFAYVCILLITVLLLSGCWNRRELNELSILLAFGIDKVDDEYEISVQAIDPSTMSKNRSSDRAPTTVFTERDSTLFEALRKMTTKSSRRMYGAHIRFIVFDEATAREGIQGPLDFLFREQEIRPDFYMAVAKNCRAKDIIGFVSPTEILPGMDMYRSLKTSHKVWAPTSAVNVKEIMSKYMLEGVEPVLTGLTLKGDIEKGQTTENAKKPLPMSNFVFEGIGVFKHDKLLGWLDEKESRGYSYITNNIKSSVAKVKCPNDDDGWFNVELIRSKAKYKPSIKNERPYMEVAIQAQGNIGEVQCDIDLMDPEMRQKMKEVTMDAFIEILNKSVIKAQEYGADVFGFGEAFHRKYPKHWREWKDEWGEMLKNDLVVDFQVDYELNLHGKINNPFSVEHNKLKEKED